MIDDGGLCGYNCELDDTPINERPEAEIEIHIYIFQVLGTAYALVHVATAVASTL